MKHHRTTTSDFGLYKELTANRKKCILVLCGGAIGAISIFVTIIYLAILLTEEAQSPIPAVSANAQTNSNSRVPGRPFEVKVIGVPLQHFTPTPPTIPPTTKKSTTLNYPQLNIYKQHYYPKNIQDVINYVTDKTLNKEFSNTEEQETRTSTSYPTYTESTKDNFYSFKPWDPSEVNLLATGNVRFAPPVWKNFNRFNQKPIPVHTYINMSNFDNPTRSPRLVKNSVYHNRLPENTDVLATVKKPLMVSINIVPMENNVIKRYPHEQDQMVKKDAMTLNLKVFPDMTYFGDEEKKNSYVQYKK